ncbi:hypothetical protein PN478_09435 [Dolichospermum circinale CS-534/05]|uniref:hypothetical protein n=1 Tax=Dolichospermum circinale TaxID=109265 RepID=UPI00232BC774|nr:hypothetical protein [Dolichospermum circinale]MDB9490743.1 hypothetical protein [Dolichospermum circinale CS-534/05]
MPTTLTRKAASNLLRNKIVRDDGNDFEKTESSFGSPLSIRTSASKTLDDKRYLSLDASARKSETKKDAEDDGMLPTGYVVPETRTVAIETLSAALAVRNKAAIADFISDAFSIFPDLIPTGGTVAPKTPAAVLNDLTPAVKSLDFTLDLLSVFNQLDNSKVVYVDAPNDVYKTVMIIGEATDGIVIAQSILVQS